MPSAEIRSILSLALIMAFRLFGLFMIFPIFAVYAEHLPMATATLIGMALGSYGLTQALLQIPFGLLSDRFGRKPIITIGLIIFAIGSIVAANAHSIYGIIAGRTLQGAGAVGSTVLALLADLTRDENRTKAMAMMGLSIGCSFGIAMVIGPLLNAHIHLSGIFWTTAAMAVMGIVLLYTLTPTPPKPIGNSEIGIKLQLWQALGNSDLLRLNYGIFALHSILTASFIILPIWLTENLGLDHHLQIQIYGFTLIAAFFAMVPFIILAEKKRQFKWVFIGAVIALLGCQLLSLTIPMELRTLVILLFLFFTAFTLLEASLPSWVSKIAPIRSKGAAMGIYSSAQFFGIFVGGSLGGWLYSHYHFGGVLAFNITVAVLWLISTLNMRAPRYLSTLIFKLNTAELPTPLLAKLNQTPGVVEVMLSEAEQLLFVKVDQQLTNSTQLRQLIGPEHLATTTH